MEPPWVGGTKINLFAASGSHTCTVDSEMFARTEFSLIFANVLPREFKVLADIEHLFLDSYYS